MKLTERQRDELANTADTMKANLGDLESKFVGVRVFEMLRAEEEPDHIKDCMADLQANAQVIIDIINKPLNVEEKLDEAA